jgi:hypothetical protein
VRFLPGGSGRGGNGYERHGHPRSRGSVRGEAEVKDILAGKTAGRSVGRLD